MLNTFAFVASVLRAASKHAPNPAIERPPPVPDSTPTIVCFSRGDTMKHFRTISRLGVRPEQLIFFYPSCKAVDTKEVIHHRGNPVCATKHRKRKPDT
jgi:hypothetical protein